MTVMSGPAEALRRASETLADRPSALITDIDGTISRIVANPEDATVSDAAKQSLRNLASQLDLIVVVTAREERVARHMVGVPELTYVGNYALRQDVAVQPAANGLDAARATAKAMTDYPGVTYEDKGIGFSLHYRNSPQPDDARSWLLARLQPLAAEHGGRLVEGKRVIEVVPAGLPTKDTALNALADQHGLRGIVFLGDDRSDVAVFRELANRRARGLASLGLAVVDLETDPQVMEAADLALAGVDAVEEFLAQLSRSLVQEARHGS